MTAPRLKPCPFCGSSEVSVGYVYAFDVVQDIAVYCADCGGQGKKCSSDSKAIAAWNKRAAKKGVSR